MHDDLKTHPEKAEVLGLPCTVCPPWYGCGVVCDRSAFVISFVCGSDGVYD